MTATAPEPRRFESLDVLRGVAIVGTLATNIWIFTDPEGLIGYLRGDRDTAAAWSVVEAVLQQLAQGKFLGLLTLMFGVGLEIQRRSAIRSGRPWPGRYPLRAGLLFLDGLLHFLLIAEFDVLMGYAVTGAIAAYLLVTAERTQRRVVVIAVAVHVTLLSALTALLLAGPATPTTPPLDPNPYADGNFVDLVVFRVQNAALFRLEPLVISALSLAMFMIGAMLLRHGVLADRGQGLRRRLMVIGAVAFVADLLLGLGLGGPGIIAARYGTAPLVALGLLALVVEVLRRWPIAGPVRRRLADIGRMALSCYVAQNVVASALCYGWGLGLAARTPPELRVPMTIAIYLLVVLVITVFAGCWLRTFARGPLETAWRWCFDALDRHLPRRVASPDSPVASEIRDR